MMDRDYVFRSMAGFLSETGFRSLHRRLAHQLGPKMVYSDVLLTEEDMKSYGRSTRISLTGGEKGGSDMARSGDSPFERSIQDSIIRRLNERECTLVRCRSADAVGHIAGDPDITGCIGGLHVEIEVKVPGEVPSRLQFRRIAEWKHVGAWATWVNSTEQALEFQQEVLATARKNGVLGPRKGTECLG